MQSSAAEVHAGLGQQYLRSTTDRQRFDLHTTDAIAVHQGSSRAKADAAARVQDCALCFSTHPSTTFSLFVSRNCMKLLVDVVCI